MSPPSTYRRPFGPFDAGHVSNGDEHQDTAESLVSSIMSLTRSFSKLSPHSCLAALTAREECHQRHRGD